VSPRKICIVVGSRANYSSIKSVMRAVRAHPDLELQLVLGASALLDRYGAVANLVRADGFEPQAEVHMLIEGETPATMAKSTGLGLLELPTIFARLAPDFVLTVGDRFETMATALAAAYMNIPLAHTMGGEVSGTIDESIRHAVTKFAHVHFAASEDAGERIIRLGERAEDVHVVGCPRIDLVAEILTENGRLPEQTDMFQEGVGDIFDLTEPFLVVSQHPVTTEYGSGKLQIAETLKAVAEIGLPAIVLWPNPDAGSEDIASGIRRWREEGLADNMHFFKNLPIETYVKLMQHAACLVGNSSSGIREGAYIGTPVVNLGSRQQRRLSGSNVMHAPHDAASIRKAIERQLEHGRYLMEPIYGEGNAGEKIADILSHKTVNTQKLITY
jgi:UDP-hydrolysing UDP-N-acetyl-D-glucosamine 2-epimerase